MTGSTRWNGLDGGAVAIRTEVLPSSGEHRSAAGASRNGSSTLEAVVRETQPALISLDVFDTLLFRGTEPERNRFEAAARAFETALAASGITVRAAEIVAARLLATRAAMSLRGLLAGQEDVPIDVIFGLVLDAVGLQPSWRGVMLDIEVESECRALALNAPLARYMRACRDKGIRVVMTSDTILSSAILTRLLLAMGASDCFDAVRTSSDYGLTKRTGTLFHVLMREEGLQPHRIVHGGDDTVNDCRSPARLGINTVYLPRSRQHRMMCRLRKGLSLRLHGTR